MKVTNDIDAREIDGNDNYDVVVGKKLTIESHWNCKNWVVIKINGADSVTVDGYELLKAISNAMNK